MNQDNIES